MINSEETYQGFHTFAAAFSSFLIVIEDDNQDNMPKTIKMSALTTKLEEEDKQGAVAVDFEVPPIPNQPVAINNPVTPRDKALFLSWHFKLGHMPFNKITWTAKIGLLPAKLQYCQNVVCPACLDGKQKRRPWRTKGQSTLLIKKSTYAGECMSVNQLISPLPELIGQTTEQLATSRYRVATIFIDHFLNIDYVHIQKATSAKDTLEAKSHFEHFAQDQGVVIRHYHANNGIFASNGFVKAFVKVGKLYPSAVLKLITRMVWPSGASRT